MSSYFEGGGHKFLGGDFRWSDGKGVHLFPPSANHVPGNGWRVLYAAQEGMVYADMDLYEFSEFVSAWGAFIEFVNVEDDNHALG